LRRVKGIADEQVVAGEIERRVRSELPGESAVHLRADVAGVALHEAPVAHRQPTRATTPNTCRHVQGGYAAGVGVHLLRGPRWCDRPVDAQIRRDAVRRSDGELRSAVAIIADVSAHAAIGETAAVEVVDSEAEDPEPAAPVAGVQIEWLVVPLA